MKGLWLWAALIMSSSWAHAQDLCNGRYQGIWSYQGGQTMTVILETEWGGRSRVTLISDYGQEVARARCDRQPDGTAEVSFRGRYAQGRLTLFRYGRAVGDIGGYSYRGRRMDDGPQYPPQPPPPPPPPQPPYRDGCSGRIDGTWFYKGGVPMTITVHNNGFNYGWSQPVNVMVQQRNGAESMQGECRSEGRGEARLVFRGQFNTGDLRISPRGEVQGVVSAHQFSGRYQ